MLKNENSRLNQYGPMGKMELKRKLVLKNPLKSQFSIDAQTNCNYMLIIH